ncbi:MAG: hypothetical protein JAY90_03780 [Candidatus Thiodiazotropha lotti]|nr:hypothetical protein [Candidatus Thiodiazotropha lotti]
MNDLEITWYMQELSMHGFGAETDFRNLEAALANPETRQTRLIWFYLSSFLSHAAMVSKYLDPIRLNDLKRERKDVLRDRLEVTEHSNVLPRDARDNIEHFDERIDNWIGRGDTILEIVLDDRVDYDHLSVVENRVKRVLIEDGLIFISEKRDQTKFELELEPLYEEIQRIRNSANQLD